MKYLLSILLILVSLGLTAQNTIIRKGSKLAALGTASDTLVQDGVIDYTIELFGDTYGVLQIGIESDVESGTPAYTAYLQKSLNNKDYANIDTITHTGGGNAYYEFDIVNATHVNYRININATAAVQKSRIYIWGKLSDGFVITQ